MRSRIALLLHAAVAATARDLDKCAGCAVVMRSLQKVLALEPLDEDKTDILSVADWTATATARASS